VRRGLASSTSSSSQLRATRPSPRSFHTKYRFAKEKKKKEQLKISRSNSQELKELKMSYKIGGHDYDVRKRQAERFLEQGNKVKFSMLFRGREVTHASVGKEIMQKMAADLEDMGNLDAAPKVMGRQMIMMVSPKEGKAAAQAKVKQQKEPSQKAPVAD
jgi:translation initiation factor IF-3